MSTKVGIIKSNAISHSYLEQMSTKVGISK